MKQGLRVLIAALGTGALAGCQTPGEPSDPRILLPSPVSVRATVPPDGAREPAATRPIQLAVHEQPALTPVDEVIDLGVALRLAGVDNPIIDLARERLREALAGQLAARSLLLPNVNIGGNYHDHTGPFQASFGGIRVPNEQSLYLGFGAGAVGSGSIAYPGVWLFAHLGDAVYEPLAARQQVTARRFDAQTVRNNTLLEAASAYLELVGAEARLAVVHRGQTDLAEIVRQTRAFADTGVGRPADAKRSETHAELLLRRERQAEEDVAVASAELCRLLSLDAAVRVRTPGGPVAAFRLVPEDTDTEALVAGAIRSRPEVFARSAAIAEAHVRRNQERVRPLLPTLSVGYSGGLFGGGSNLVAPEFGSLKGRSDFDVVAVWNIQNLGFGNRARVRRTDAVYGEALAGYDIAVNQIRCEVVVAVSATRAAAKQIELAKTSVARAEEGFRLDDERVRGGFGRPIEVLDSFQQLLDSRLELVRAIVAFDVAQFQLYVATGRDPEGSAPVPAPSPPPARPPAP